MILPPPVQRARLKSLLALTVNVHLQARELREQGRALLKRADELEQTAEVFDLLLNREVER